MFRLITKSFTQQNLPPKFAKYVFFPFIMLLNFFYWNYLRYVRENHYEVLNLKPNCSEKDIRESFVKLSKQVRITLRVRMSKFTLKFILYKLFYNIAIKIRLSRIE